MDVRPHRIQQLLLSDQPAGPRRQKQQDGKSLWRQRDLFASTPQALVHRIQPERVELVFPGRHRTVTPSSQADHDCDRRFTVSCTCQRDWKPIYRTGNNAMRNLSFTIIGIWAVAGCCQAAEVLTLEQAVAAAIENNRGLRSSALEARKAQDKLNANRTRQLPGINFYALGAQ